MRRNVWGLVLLGLGAFLLAVGVVTTAWAPEVVKRTPLDVDQTTHLSGTVQKLDGDTGELGAQKPVKVLSLTKTDTDASTDDVVAFVTTTCVVIDENDAPDCVDAEDPRAVDISSDVFASDRVTALTVDHGADLPADAVPHEGLVNKWPFDAEKKTYPFWDGTLGRAVDAVYDRTATLDGVTCYVYRVSIKDEPAEIVAGTRGTYSNQVEVWVEPKTGSIQQQTQDQQRYLDDGTQVLDLKVGFTDGSIAQFADDARSNMRLLDVITVWLPIVGFVGGAVCVLAGLALLLTGRRRRSTGTHQQREMAAASS